MVTELPYAEATTLDNPDDLVPTIAPEFDGDTQKILADTFSKTGIALDGAAPEETLPEPDCPDDVSGVAYNFFTTLSNKFCDAVNVDKGTALQQDLSNEDAKRRRLKVRTPPVSADDYADYKFHFDWSGSDGDCAMECGDAFGSLVAKCSYSHFRSDPPSFFTNVCF